MKNRFTISAAAVFLMFGLLPSRAKVEAVKAEKDNLIRYVDPFIGTDRMGHTFPGATVPFGAVQLSPDTESIAMFKEDGSYNPEVYRYCAGYQYHDPTIVGFSHTHFSGTGHSDLGDLLIVPQVGELKLEPGSAVDPQSGYRSTYVKENEFAEPNYYRVLLDQPGVLAELTTSTRVGLHRYTFPETEQAHILLDLVHGIYNYPGKNVWTFLRLENERLLTGYRQTSGWARTRTVYFAVEFSRPVREYGFIQAGKQPYIGFWRRFDQERNFPEAAGRELKAYFSFDCRQDRQILVKVGLSPVSAAGALANLRAEVPYWDFEQVKNEGQQAWNRELGRIRVETLTPEDRVSFYTALYHAMLGPTVYMDVDGRYRGLDQEIHRAEGFTNYTSFSLWDTYRALHPLFTIIQTGRTTDMIKSMLAHYRQSVHRMLPIWSHYANENWCMIGYHAVSVIADAWIKGIRDFDGGLALEACLNTARNPHYDALPWYAARGYVPEDLSANSASKTLEFAYNDWCIARLALALGQRDIYEEFSARANNFRNVFDRQSGFMRPRLSDGSFLPGFDPLDTHGQGFIEGNAWNYSLYVPHAPLELVRLKGGRKKFGRYLDRLFSMELPEEYFAATEDISPEGIIGNYVHGNEPSHHVPYLYNWSDRPWKTQETVRMICRSMYRPTPDGLPGNDDFGQMSAWYLFSALGFYPLAPGDGQYVFGSPLVKSAEIRLENGRVFRIETENQSEENVYLSRILLNGRPLERSYLRHEEITAGGTLVFSMSATPAN